MIHPQGSVLTPEANSVERLEMLLDLLEDMGAEAEAVARTTVDPAEELARRTGEPSELAGRDRPAMSPEAFNAWARTWPDEGVPGLEGMTPRLAATCLWPYPAGGQLRDLEHRAAASGVAAA
jgi:hypothetical protein